MNGDATGSAGLGTDDPCGASKHPFGFGNAVEARVRRAKAALEGSNRQEAQEACDQLEAACIILEAWRVVEEGERRGEGVGEKDGAPA